ncbi:hypothetical protein JCM10369A_43820 [Nocardioides pyridinolyticus]
MNVSGHRLSTTEIESALVSHPRVAEATAVGAADQITGQAVVAYVILREGVSDGATGEALVQELRTHVATEIGAIAKPRSIMIVPELPKTRSGKIMRHLLSAQGRRREPHGRRHHHPRRPIRHGPDRRRPIDIGQQLSN